MDLILDTSRVLREPLLLKSTRRLTRSQLWPSAVDSCDARNAFSSSLRAVSTPGSALGATYCSRAAVALFVASYLLKNSFSSSLALLLISAATSADLASWVLRRISPTCNPTQSNLMRSSCSLRQALCGR